MKSTLPRYSLLWFILTFPVVCAQADSAHHRGRNFTSPDGLFRFEYADSLVSCKRDLNQANGWVPDKSCEAHTPVCSNLSCDSSGTVACIAYPATEMKDTNFQAAAFSVNELKELKAESECLKVEEPPPHVGTARSETVNGITFEVTETDGVELGNLVEG